MDTNNLKAALEQLHQDLEAGRDIDPELRHLLKTLDRDIHQTLDQGAQDPDTLSALNERAQEIDARFSAQHPYLSSTLRDVADILGKMGI